MNLQEQANALQEARGKVEALLRHFTRTPSTLADSTARVQGHQALEAIDEVLASLTAQAALSGHIATVVEGNLANRLEWASEEAHGSTPVGTKLYDDSAAMNAFAAGRDAGLEVAAKALSGEACDWERRAQAHSGMLGTFQAKEDFAKRDVCLEHARMVRSLMQHREPSAT